MPKFFDQHEIIAKRDETVPIRAREAFQAAVARTADARKAVADAVDRIAQARTDRADLVQRAADGEVIASADMLKAETVIREAEAAVLFRREALAGAEARQTQAETKLRTAESDGWEPVMTAAVAQRIRAAESIVEARKALIIAENNYNFAAGAMNHALATGAKIRLGFNPASNSEMLRAVLNPEFHHPETERRNWKLYEVVE